MGDSRWGSYLPIFAELLMNIFIGKKIGANGYNRVHYSYLIHDGYIELQCDPPLSELDQEKMKVIFDIITKAYENNKDVEKCVWGHANTARHESSYITFQSSDDDDDDDEMCDIEYPYKFHNYWATNNLQKPTKFRLLYSIKMCDYLTNWNIAENEELEEEDMPNRSHLMKRDIKTLSCGDDDVAAQMYNHWKMSEYSLYEVDLFRSGQDVYLSANIINSTAMAPGMEGHTLIKFFGHDPLNYYRDKLDEVFNS